MLLMLSSGQKDERSVATKVDQGYGAGNIILDLTALKSDVNIKVFST
jgi:hypothetical protein